MRTKNKYEEQAVTLCAAAVAAAGYELLEVNYRREGQEKYLTFIIDRRGGIGIEDCETVNNIVEPLLDATDIFSEAYNLEVSSAGLDRPLQTEADFKRYYDSPIILSTYKKFADCKQFIGCLQAYADGAVTLLLDFAAMEKLLGRKAFKSFRQNLQTEMAAAAAETEIAADTEADLADVSLTFAPNEWSSVKRYYEF